MQDEIYNKLTFREALEYHEELRNELYQEVSREYSALGITAREIKYADVKEADSWKNFWTKQEKAASWNWCDLYDVYRSRRGARRFDLAITKGGRLLGLSYGMLENRRLILKLHAMEANPRSNPISGGMLEITLFAADIYADVNRSSEIWICDPVSDAHVRLYQGRGFVPYYDRFDKCTHLMRKVR